MKFIKGKDLYFLLIIGLIKIVHGLSSSTLRGLFANTIALAAYQCSRDKRRKGEENLLKTFNGNIDATRRRRIVREAFAEFWQEVFSLAPLRKEKTELRRVDLHGMEHLDSALKKGRGIILWESSHFGRRNLAKQILHEHGFTVHQVHAENHLGGFFNERVPGSWVRHHLVKHFFDKCEKQFVKEIIYLSGSDSLAFTRILWGRLKQNAILCISGDGNLGQKRIPRAFLGHIGLFPTGMVSLAKISGAPILPVFCFQEGNGQTKLIIEPPIHIERGVDRELGLENSITQYVSLLESYIRRYPGMYRNWQSLGEMSMAETSRGSVDGLD